jgi:hypothetical protein
VILPLAAAWPQGGGACEAVVAQVDTVALSV